VHHIRFCLVGLVFETEFAGFLCVALAVPRTCFIDEAGLELVISKMNSRPPSTFPLQKGLSKLY